jgi:ABC-2 type transport system permease protein
MLPKIVIIFGAATWLIITLMFSQAIMLSVIALFECGDFDLLLSSPLNTRVVFTVRGMGIAMSCVMLYFLQVTRFAHAGDTRISSQSSWSALHSRLWGLRGRGYWLSFENRYSQELLAALYDDTY